MHGVLMFPGQGAYDSKAVAALARAFPEVAEVYSEVDEGARAGGAAPPGDMLLAESPPSIEALLDDASDTLQLAIFAVSMAVHRLLVRHGARPGVLVGHSLGEISALTAAGALSVTAGAELVAHRCAAVRAVPATGAMAALACDVGRAERILALVADPTAAVAAANAPTQTVVSGPVAAVEAAVRIARALHVGAVSLKTPHAFHSPVLAPAAVALADRLRAIPVSIIQVPVFSPILDRYYEPQDDLPELLAGHLVRPVHFGAAARQLRAAGASAFVECGVGAVLAGLARRSVELARVYATIDPPAALDSTIHQAVAHLSEPTEVATGAGPAARAVEGRFPAAMALDVTPPRLVTIGSVARGAGSGPGPAPATRAQLFAELQSVYAEALEYPIEVFSEDVALEADLGVDSVKQTELFARTVERYQLGEPTEGLQLADYDTMGKVVDLVWSFLAPAGQLVEPTEVATGAGPAAHAVEGRFPAAASLDVTAPRVVTIGSVAPGAGSGPGPAPATRAQLFAELQSVYAEALEYPIEVFSEDVALEADLGVDSVKQTELFARTVERYQLGEPTEGLQLADYDTMGKVVDLVWSFLPAAAAVAEVGRVA